MDLVEMKGNFTVRPSATRSSEDYGVVDKPMVRDVFIMTNHPVDIRRYTKTQMLEGYRICQYDMKTMGSDVTLRGNYEMYFPVSEDRLDKLKSHTDGLPMIIQNPRNLSPCDIGFFPCNIFVEPRDFDKVANKITMVRNW